MFGIWGYDRLWNGVAAIVLPHNGWLEEPLREGVRWDGVAFGAHAGKYVCSLIKPHDETQGLQTKLKF